MENKTFNSTSAGGVALDNWRTAQLNLAKAKAEEKEAKEIALAYLKDMYKLGTTHFSTDHTKLKVVVSQSYKVDTTDYQGALNTALSQIAQYNPEQANALIKWSPTVSKTVYDQLSSECKSIINPLLKMEEKTTISLDKENK